MPVCLCVGQLMDASESECAQQIVSVLGTANNRAEQYYYVYENKESANCRRDAKGSEPFGISLSPFRWLEASNSTMPWRAAYTFSTQLSLLFSPPLPAVSLCSLWVMGTDGRQLLAVSLGSTPPFSTTPGPLQLMAWLQRLLRNSNVGPISSSASRGVMGGLGKRFEVVGVVREGGLLLREEKRCRLSREDNCTEFAMWGCVRVCCRCAFMHAFPFLLYICVCLWVCVCDHYWICPSLRYHTVLCRFISANCTAKDTVFTAG